MVPQITTRLRKGPSINDIRGLNSSSGFNTADCKARIDGLQAAPVDRNMGTTFVSSSNKISETQAKHQSMLSKTLELDDRYRCARKGALDEAGEIQRCAHLIAIANPM